MTGRRECGVGGGVIPKSPPFVKHPISMAFGRSSQPVSKDTCTDPATCPPKPAKTRGGAPTPFFGSPLQCGPTTVTTSAKRQLIVPSGLRNWAPRRIRANTARWNGPSSPTLPYRRRSSSTNAIRVTVASEPVEISTGGQSASASLNEVKTARQPKGGGPLAQSFSGRRR